jgi:hypothetical protein
MLIYIIGGEIEDLVSERVMADVPLQELIPITDSTNDIENQVL